MSDAKIDISWSITGGNSLINKLKKLSGEAESKEVIFTSLQEGGLMIQADAVRSIVKTTGGSTSAVRYDPKRNVKVSPPGGAPNADTGRLHQSIRVAFNKGAGWVEVGTDLLYGAWLEFGTRDMAARPWLLPAYQKNLKAITELIKDRARDAIRRLAK